jgi:imidazolonepropionase-like amidohydrolase
MIPGRVLFIGVLGFAASVGSALGQNRKQSLALVGATVIDGTGALPLRDAVVLIESGRIVAIGSRARTKIPDHFERRDLRGLTVLPGLIDSHVHLNFALPQGPNDPKADLIINGVLQDFLRHGVTSIRDLGAGYPWIIELRQSVDEGRRIGPRIFAAGPLLTAPGGHPAGTLLVGNKPAIETGTRQITTPDEGRAVVRELASGGVDTIKAVVDSGGRRSRPQRIPTLNAETLAAIVSEAHSLGLPVTVHWGNVDELPAIIAAHPTQIEHAGYVSIPQSLISEIAHAGIVVDPTLAVLSSAATPEEFATGSFDSVRRLHASGVVITAGTDSPLGNSRFGESLQRELELLVGAGLSPMEAIQAATSRPASLLKRGSEIGTLQAGKRADVITVAGDPLEAISNIRNVRMVIRDGQVFYSAP